MKILIVEDDISSLDYFAAILDKEKFNYQTALNGVDGINKFEKYKPDVVLSDINMFEMNGLELLERVKLQRPDTLVVMLTACTSEDYVIKAMKLGANNYLKKPIDKNELINLLRNYKLLLQNKRNLNDISGLVEKQKFSMQFNSNIDLIPAISTYLINETGLLFDSEKQLDLKLGLSELLFNAVEHGNLKISFIEKNEALINDTLNELYNERLSRQENNIKKVSIDFEQNKNYCEWVISDEGEGFDPKSIPDPLSGDGRMRLHGRGIFICKYQFDEMEYMGCGNKVRVRKYFSK